jgi:hypothetical protein
MDFEPMARTEPPAGAFVILISMPILYIQNAYLSNAYLNKKAQTGRPRLRCQ